MTTDITLLFILLIPIVSIFTSIIIIGGLRSRKNPGLEWCMERYVISHKYAFPSTAPFLVIAYYNRLENKIVISISSLAMIVWKKISEESMLDREALREAFTREFIKHIDLALIHELTEWGVHQLHPRWLLTHGLWNQYIRSVILTEGKVDDL
ncbi:MAG: hypothetical protein ABDH32_05560 [Candidatus Caldarchaeales archaeon]